MSLQHVSTLTGSPSGGTFDTFKQQGQRNKSPDVKFNLMCGVYCVPQHMAATVHACCLNVSTGLPAGDPLRVETCWRDIQC